MEFGQTLVPATLIKRYKRFLADVELESGEVITVHCPNTGKMTGCDVAGSRVWLLDSNNPKRKYCYTWELVELNQDRGKGGGHWICIHSARANALVEEAINKGLLLEALPELADFPEYRREVAIPEFNSTLPEVDSSKVNKKKKKTVSRADFCLFKADANVDKADSIPLNQKCFVEVKSVTLLEADSPVDTNQGYFPDTVSDRAKRHLQDLTKIVEQGGHAVLVFGVLHTGIGSVSPADHIDPKYGEAFRVAVDTGVKVVALKAQISEAGIEFVEAVPVIIKR